ncbi:MAG: hypothetical protein ACTHMC_28365 [Pseudobacter sp.]|uniref:hypothetical protein n=1 Tax=Pseudobacter sp. TaxID=2045420 RepID=UPI003F8146C0
MALSKVILVQRMIDDLIRQAAYFLEESGEFYPFALYADGHQQIRNISFFTKDEFPAADEVLKELEALVLSGLKAGQYKAALIGVNVHAAAPGVSPEIHNAMEVRSYDEHGNLTLRYSRYQKREDGYEFSELIDPNNDPNN